MAAVSAVYVLLKASSTVPEWMYLNPFLSILAFAFSFQRIKLTMEIEHITAPAWDALVAVESDRWKMTDLILTFPYLFSLFVLPFMAISFQLFIVDAVVFYGVLSAYHFMAESSIRTFYENDIAELSECPVYSYYTRRRWITLGVVVAASLAGVIVWWAVLAGATGLVVVVASVFLIGLLLVESVVEYVVGLELYSL